MKNVTIHGLGESLKPRQMMEMTIKFADGRNEDGAAALPHRDARRARIFQARRHLAVCAAPARRMMMVRRDFLVVRERIRSLLMVRDAACSGSSPSRMGWR